MRILIAHEAPAGAGGVESYLACLMPGLLSRGHQLAFLHDNPQAEPGPTCLRHAGVPAFGVADAGLDAAMARARQWEPDLAFSHNMRQLEIDRRLVAACPTVKMMHGYFGTCIGGQKAHAFPSVTPCTRVLGPACLGLYFPRRCGQLRPALMISQYRWASRQRTLLGQYAHVVVASDHMADEYQRHGVAPGRLTVAPLFPTIPLAAGPRPLPVDPVVLFAGRMTRLKGGDVLVEAAAHAARRLGRPVSLIFAGAGPESRSWQALATRRQVPARFTGWVSGAARTTLMREASLVAVPSLWPEPFGLVGLEAALHGVPAVGFDAGGIRQWLRDGVSGRLVPEVGDPRALGEALASMLGDPRTLGALGEGATRVAAEFAIDAHLDRLEAVFARARGSQ